MASLADYLGQRSPRSLLDAAEALSEERLDGRLFATLSPRLRMVASGPDAGDDYRLTALGADGSGGEGAFDRSGVGELLRQAREAHALTVVDCGSLQREVERDVVRSASHVVWTARGDGIGELRAATTLAHFGGINRGERVLAVRPAGRRERVSTRRWLRIADVAGARLVVVPYLDELARQLDRAPAASAAIDGLVATLR